MYSRLNVIDGVPVEGQGDAVDVVDPSTERTLGTFRGADQSQVGCAVEAARNCFDNGEWRGKSWSVRAQVLRNCAQRIRKSAEELVSKQVLETGILKSASHRHIMGAAAWFDYYADFLTIQGGSVHHQLANASTLVTREPIGVCALFSPWNVPIGLTAIKLAPALAAGNSVVIKPSEQTPATVRGFIDAVLESGDFPPGCINLVNGSGATTGAALATVEGVDMMSFTGGAAGGRAVGMAAAERHIPVVMELGGKSAFIVFEDADLDAALGAAVQMGFGNNGQACLAGSRLLLQASIAEEFTTRFVARVNGLTVGLPTDEQVNMGPLASATQYKRVLSYYQAALDDGDTVLCGGELANPGKGYFVRPGLVQVNGDKSRVWREEIFGPLVAIREFDDESEAIRLGNDSVFGLSGYLWTRDIKRALRVSRAMRTGTVIVNGGMQRELNAPFGGYRESGIGREGGKYSWNNFTEAKTTVLLHS